MPVYTSQITMPNLHSPADCYVLHAVLLSSPASTQQSSHSSHSSSALEDHSEGWML